MTALYLLLMALTGYRLTVLVVRDTFPPVLWVRDRIVGGWRPMTGKEHDQYRNAPRVKIGQSVSQWKLADDVPSWMKTVQSIDFEGVRGTQESRWVDRASWVPGWLSELMSCPWCASGWIALVLACTGAAQGFYAWNVLWMVWGAVWAVAALMAVKDGAS